jgi:hypothetical protein
MMLVVCRSVVSEGKYVVDYWGLSGRQAQMCLAMMEDSSVGTSASIERWTIDVNTDRGVATCLPSDLVFPRDDLRSHRSLWSARNDTRMDWLL